MENTVIEEVEILQKARSLLADPSNWIQGIAAKDDSGMPCEPESDKAVSWCLMGAIDRSTNSNFGMYVLCRNIMRDAVPVETAAYVTKWNDSQDRTHQDILRAFDDGIERARGG